jgi:catechol 2,3-dioxygenase-like lactoylglutathione lyase family enzyme
MPLRGLAMNLFQVNPFVRSFQQALSFYRDALGFEVNEVNPGPPCVPLVNWVSLLTGTLVVELFDAKVFAPGLDAANDSDGIELCFIVDDVSREDTASQQRRPDQTCRGRGLGSIRIISGPRWESSADL